LSVAPKDLVREERVGTSAVIVMNDHIAFDKIRGDLPEGQRGAFEELVSQLARRAPENAGSFRRIEGAGGDGGVECVHDRRGGGIVGYQAKYHVKAGDID
jgi:hypothetical protein